MNVRQTTWFVSLCFLGLAVIPAVAAKQATYADQFMTEAPKAWKAYYDAFMTGHNNARQTTTFGLPNGQTRSIDIEYESVFDTGYHKSTYWRIPKSDEIKVSITNPDYVATISQANDKWKLETLKRTNPDDSQLSSRSNGSQAVSIGGFKLWELVDQPGFVVHEVSPESDHTVTVSFSVAIPSGPSITNGRMTLDPANFWCVTSADYVDSASGETVAVRNQYANDEGDPPAAMTSWEVSTLSPKGRHTLHYDYEIDRVPPGLGPNDYRLTAFGLPEPDWAKPQRPWWLYAVLGGLGLVVAAVVIAKFVRWKSRA